MNGENPLGAAGKVDWTFDGFFRKCSNLSLKSRMLLSIYLEEQPLYLDKTRDALSNCQWRSAAQYIQKMKSASRSVGIQPMYLCLDSLEQSVKMKNQDDSNLWFDRLAILFASLSDSLEDYLRQV